MGNMPVDSPKSVATAPPLAAPRSARLASPVWRFALFALVLAICFTVPLYGLIRLALHSELYSHILLIPFITLYLIWIRRSEAGVGKSHLSPALSTPLCPHPSPLSHPMGEGNQPRGRGTEVSVPSAPVAARS